MARLRPLRLRGLAAFEGGIASLAVDGTYPVTAFDVDGRQLSGGTAYTIQFDALPPVEAPGFWSLTVYANSSASGVDTNLPALTSASALNTFYSPAPATPVTIVDATHLQGSGFADNDTIFFTAPAAGSGLDANRPYYVLNARGDVFQLSATWSPSASEMTPLTLGATGQSMLAGDVIPVYALGSQQLSSLQLNADASLTLYLQSDAPADPFLVHNWLPIPATGTFQVMARLYLPTPATPQSRRSSILSDTTIPLTTSSEALARLYPQEPICDANHYGTYVVPGLTP